MCYLSPNTFQVSYGLALPGLWVTCVILSHVSRSASVGRKRWSLV